MISYGFVEDGYVMIFFFYIVVVGLVNNWDYGLEFVSCYFLVSFIESVRNWLKYY